MKKSCCDPAESELSGHVQVKMSNESLELSKTAVSSQEVDEIDQGGKKRPDTKNAKNI